MIIRIARAAVLWRAAWVATGLAACLAGPAAAQNVGTAPDIAAIESSVHADGSSADKILQIVVVGQYAAVILQREGETVTSTAAYTQRGNKLRPQQPGWHLAGLIAAIPAPCWLEQYGFPKNVAAEIASDIPAMKRVAQSNPRYECD